MSITKSLLVASLMFLFSSEGFTQTRKLKFAEQFILGTSIAYKFDNVRNVYRYNEWSWSLNAAINIDHHFMVGLHNSFILSHGTRVPRDKFDLYGAFVQYDFFDKSKNRLYAELGLYKGNYCTCGEEDPYKVPNLNYFNFGAGFELSIHKNFNLEFGLLVYRILNKIEEQKYGHTQYVAGINYIISK